MARTTTTERALRRATKLGVPPIAFVGDLSLCFLTLVSLATFGFLSAANDLDAGYCGDRLRLVRPHGRRGGVLDVRVRVLSAFDVQTPPTRSGRGEGGSKRNQKARAVRRLRTLVRVFQRRNLSKETKRVLFFRRVARSHQERTPHPPFSCRARSRTSRSTRPPRRASGPPARRARRALAPGVCRRERPQTVGRVFRDSPIPETADAGRFCSPGSARSPAAARARPRRTSARSRTR